MTLEEFYTKVGGDYKEVSSRLLTDDRIMKYLQKFPNTGDYENLKAALASNQWENAFLYAHNLKGICVNLGLIKLFEPSSALCENLRGGKPKEDCAPYLEKVSEQYIETLSTIEEFFEG